MKRFEYHSWRVNFPSNMSEDDRMKNIEEQLNWRGEYGDEVIYVRESPPDRWLFLFKREMP